MFLQNLRAKVAARLSGDREAGFTLIELLVVMLILGILAAIALPAFFNQRDKAGDSKAKEEAHTAQVAMETYATEHGGKYTGVNIGLLNDIEPTVPATEPTGTNPGIKLSGIADATYTITSVSSTGNEFKISNNAGAMTYLCKTPGKGGCPPATGTETETDWSK